MTNRDHTTPSVDRPDREARDQTAPDLELVQKTTTNYWTVLIADCI